MEKCQNKTFHHHLRLKMVILVTYFILTMSTMVKLQPCYVLNSSHIFQVKVWNPETEECLHTLSGHTNRVYSLQFDGIHVVSGSLDTSIRVWDVETGNL